MTKTKQQSKREKSTNSSNMAEAQDNSAEGDALPLDDIPVGADKSSYLSTMTAHHHPLDPSSEDIIQSNTSHSSVPTGELSPVTAFLQSRPPGEPKVRRPRRSSRTGGEFTPGSARFSSPVVVPVGGAKGITAMAERPSRRPKRTADWGRTRPAFFSLSPAVQLPGESGGCSGRGGRGRAGETSSGTGLILACRFFFSPHGGSEELHRASGARARLHGGGCISVGQFSARSTRLPRHMGLKSLFSGETILAAARIKE
ncbi:hypothetical protein NDU88_002794 [Pleurodeles waltl]|uniref:Uncharacterized protein n=1 Tax=Pleurodeles waltl TaxID=8319 RepID=A0AAV7M239_PLEWA|nr:hypothetical protein NDU88_002794 [Pleurodeles waltl]